MLLLWVQAQALMSCLWAMLTAFLHRASSPVPCPDMNASAWRPAPSASQPAAGKLGDVQARMMASPCIRMR